jgi:hypothetical protein
VGRGGGQGADLLETWVWDDRASGALRCLHLARPIAVAIAGLLPIAALVTLTAKNVGNLTLKRLLDNQPKRQANQIAPSSRCSQFSIHQGAKLLARALRRG